MLSGFAVAEGRIVEKETDRAEILVFAAPDEAEKARLVSEFKLDSHTLASALDPDEPSRLEFEPDHLALIFKRPQNYSAKDQFVFKVASTGLFLFRDRLVVLLSEDIPMFPARHFHGIENLRHAFLKILDSSLWHYLEHLRVINMIANEIEQKISVSMENKHLLNLFSLEKSLVYYLNAINSNAFVIEKLKNNGAKVGFAAPHMELLDDILIENQQCYRQAEIYSNILASLMDARVSIVSNNLNILMKTLNLITIGIMVPTLVVSVFSMNVAFPYQHHPLMFWVIILLAMGSVAGMMFWWRRKRW